MRHDWHLVHLLPAGLAAGQEEPPRGYSLHRAPVFLPPHWRLLARIRRRRAALAVIATVLCPSSGLSDARRGPDYILFVLVIPLHLQFQRLAKWQRHAGQGHALALVRPAVAG